MQTKYGMVTADQVLFLAACAVHVSKPCNRAPELHGPIPIRVELKSHTEPDVVRIMTEPENALAQQCAALVAAEGATLEFTPDDIAEIAEIAASVNARMENIGARRLHTVMTTQLEDSLFEMRDGAEKRILINAEAVREQLEAIVGDDNLLAHFL